MYATMYQLGESGLDDRLLQLQRRDLGETTAELDERRLYYLKKVRAMNSAIAYWLSKPPTPEIQQTVALQTAEMKRAMTELRKYTTAANASELTTFDRTILAAGEYTKKVVQAGGQIIKDTVGFVAETAGSAAAAATTPLILPLLAIAVGLYLVGKGGVIGQATSFRKL